MIRTAVIGAGYIAREHLDCLRSLPGVEVAGLCDRSPVMAEATAEQYGIPSWFDDHRKMLGELRPDVVHVTTPPQSHVALAVDALEAGAHVLVEKPIALDPAALTRLEELAERQGLWLLEDHNYRFNASVQQILRKVASGELGEVVHVDVIFAVDVLGAGSRHADPAAPDPYTDLPGGPVIDFVTHLAYLSQLFVGPHRSVSTEWRRRGQSGARWDEFRALVGAERGTATLGFSANAQPDAFSLVVHGTRMRARASLFEPLLALERVYAGPRPLHPLRNGLAQGAAHARSALGGLWRKLQGRPLTYEGLWELLRRLYAALAEGGPPPVTREDVDAANRLVWAMLAQEPGR